MAQIPRFTSGARIGAGRGAGQRDPGLVSALLRRRVGTEADPELAARPFRQRAGVPADPKAASLNLRQDVGVKADPEAAGRPFRAAAAAGNAMAQAGAQVAGLALRQQAEIDSLRAQQQDKADSVEAAVIAAKARAGVALALNEAQNSGAPFSSEAFVKAQQDQLTEVLNTASPGVAERLAAPFAGLTGDMALKATVFEGRQRAAQRATDMQSAIDFSANEVRSDPKMLALRLEENRALLQEQGLPPDVLGELTRRSDNALGLAAVSGLAESDPMQALTRLDSGEFDALLRPGDKDSAIGAAQAELARRAAKMMRLRNEQIARINTALDDLGDNSKAGFSAGPEQWAALRQAAGQTGDAAVMLKVAEVEKLATARSSAVRMPPVVLAQRIAEREAELHALPPGQLDPADVRELSEMKSVAAEMAARIQKDQRGYAAEIGLIPKDSRPVSLVLTPTGDAEADQRQAEGLKAAIVERRNEAWGLARHFGTAPQFLSPAVKQVWAQTFDTGTLDQQVATLGFIGDAFGPRDTPLVLRELSQTDPMAAHLAGLLSAGGDAAVARDALIGRSLVKQDGAVAPGPLDRELAEAGLRQAYGRGDALAGANVAETAMNIYVAQRQRLGDRAKYEDAVQLAAGARIVDGVQYGGLSEYNGFAVVAPPGVRADSFEDAVQGLSDARLQAGSVGNAAPRDNRGRVHTAADLRNAWLVSVGDGRYAVSSTDPSRGNPKWWRGSGQAGLFELDWKQVQAFVDAGARRARELGLAP